MDRLDIEACLDSMTVLVDSREQPTDKAKKRYESFGVPYRRHKLNYGDYTYNFVLPSGSELHKVDIPVDGAAVIERKMNLEELSSCFTHDRKRFQAEFERAIEKGASVYLLVENASWENLLNGKYKTKFNSKSFTASLVAWSVRYGIKIIFCKSESTGKLIKEILYRELKERLEQGVYG